jgi:RNA polymerase sigma factor (sigma-70 family)
MMVPLPFESGDLPERMCKLESSAFEEFSERYIGPLEEFFARGGAPEADAEELALDCVSEIALHIGRYQRFPKATFNSWVTSFARHKRADWQRRHFRFPQPVLFEDTDGILSLASPETEPLQPDNEVHDAVRDALNRLSRLQRDVLDLIYQDIATTSREIGQILRVQPGTVRQAHARGLGRLKKMLERDPRVAERLRRARYATTAVT